MPRALHIAAVTIALALSLSASAAPVRDLISQCAACHGDAGIAKEFDVPNLAGQHSAYLFNQMKAFRAGRRAHKEMRVMSRQMTEEEMRAIADYYASLPPR